MEENESCCHGNVSKNVLDCHFYNEYIPLSFLTAESVLVQLLVALHSEMSPCFILDEIQKQVGCTFADFDLIETPACQHM